MVVIAVVALLLLAGGAWSLEPAKGVFESCPACKLDSMPELKRFFHDSVMKGEYGDRLSVKFIPGATPKLILFGADGKELSREDVSDKLKFDELHSWVQGKGFSKAATAATAAQAGASQSKEAATPAPIPAAAGRPRYRIRGNGEGMVQRRRRLIPVTKGEQPQGAAGVGGQGGQPGAMKRRRRRKAAAGAAGETQGAQMRLRRRRRRAAAAGPGAEARH
eukprot:GHUV01003762.1.p2 GENE.GHUV01003762.1~~GHUV01003762.1.p2  ORF type:complete len:220 (+),score=69.01 GHUV01003762.1:165-824(+)